MPFGTSDPRIYDNMVLEGELNEWAEKDHYGLMGAIVNGANPLGLHWDGHRQLLTQQGPKIVECNTPWCHMQHAPRMKCGMDHHVMFNTWGIIPPRCLDCWKVVVSPRTFHELVELEKLQYILDKPSKCGIELRDYTPRFYGGYFYNHSLDEGQARYKEVRDAVSEVMSPDINVILKRACTEYEMIKGPSHLWTITSKEEELYELVQHYVRLHEIDHNQPQLFKRHVRMKWALWAHMNGDMTYMDYNNGKQLWPSCLTYHEAPAEDYKHDLALGRALTRHAVKPEVTDEFWKEAHDFANKNDIEPQALTTMLGSNTMNPLMLRKSFSDTQIGGHDELT
jgi:hypothetical protein